MKQNIQHTHMGKCSRITNQWKEEKVVNDWEQSAIHWEINKSR
jgi:hypothetical protein